MQTQKSFQAHNVGTLYLVATPIGNLEDITFRALKTMKEVDLIAAEDTRQTKKLCNYFEIATPLISYHDHNKESSGYKLIEDLKNGKSIALVSDAGTPCISDPGYELVCQSLLEEIPVVPLPGANAAISALIASGLPTQHFYYYGFLRRHKKEKKAELESLRGIRDSLIFYEAPHRLKETLQAIEEVLGNRRIVLCRELTKKFEEFIRGTVAEVLVWSQEETVRGEFCVIVEGSLEEPEVEEAWWETLTMVEHVEHHINEGLPSKEAIKVAAKERGVQKRVVYQEYHGK